MTSIRCGKFVDASHRTAENPLHTRLYPHKHLQHTLLPCIFKGSQTLIKRIAGADQRAHIDKLLTQSTQRRFKWATSRSLHSNLVNHNRGEVKSTPIRDSALQNNGSPRSHQSQCQLQPLRRSAALDNHVDAPPVL